MVEPTVTFSLIVFTGAPVRRCLITVRFSGAIVSEPVVVAWVVVVVVTDVWASAGAAAATPSAARPAIKERVILLPPEILRAPPAKRSSGACVPEAKLLANGSILPFGRERPRPAQPLAPARPVEVEDRAEGHDAARVDGPVALVIVPLDVLEVHRPGDARDLVEVAQVA